VIIDIAFGKAVSARLAMFFLGYFRFIGLNFCKLNRTYRYFLLSSNKDEI